MSEVAAAVTEAAMAGVISGTSAQTDSSQAGLNRLTSINTGRDATQDGAGSSTEEFSSEGPPTNENPAFSDQGSRPEVDLDADQMAMRLALDVLWTGSGSGAAQQSSQVSGSTNVQQ